MAGSSDVHHKTPLPEGIRVGTVMRIRGVVPNNANRFFVNLLCSEGQDAEYALHFNPRLNESTVVFNTLEQGAWGPEERGSGIPFQHGQPFEVLLIATEDGFKVCLSLRGGRQDPGSSAVGGRPLVEVAKAGHVSPGPLPPLAQTH
ncbi:PREDICTED: galectin-7 isoform X1 [Ceratotherium simum simum]|uniref:Galectin n=1 Tax=Ceratotherium simum simum TaxID=73337 RepID=A0ABM1DIG1_CERSS|nr:PREDICTED: galectin-7 isoform X1 [Ceratotherium simum simum]